MSNMKKVIYFVLMLLVIINQSLAKTLKIGAVAFHPPFIMKNSGFEIEFIKLVCKRMSVACEIDKADYYDLLTGLHEGKFDLTIGGFMIPAERSFMHQYSRPYLQSKGQFLTLASNPETQIKSFYGKNIGIIYRKEYLNSLKKQYGDKLNHSSL